MMGLKGLLCATALAASAHAQLYAAPDGRGGACSKRTPCSLETALTTADAGSAIKLAGVLQPFVYLMCMFGVHGQAAPRIGGGAVAASGGQSYAPADILSLFLIIAMKDR